MRKFLAAIFLVSFAGSPMAQQAKQPDASKLWQAFDKAHPGLLLSRNICSDRSRKCQAICEANKQLNSAAVDLSQCASIGDYNDSCDSQFRDVEDAHDELENAVSEAAGDCE